MKKLPLLLAVLFACANFAFAQEKNAEDANPLEQIFEMEEIKSALPQKLEIEIKNSQSFQDLQNDFHQIALQQSEKDFVWAENLILVAIALILFTSSAFAIIFTLQYFSFRRLLISETRNFENTAREKMREVGKVCDTEKHNIQSIVDSQQKILNEMKEKLGLQQKLPIEKEGS